MKKFLVILMLAFLSFPAFANATFDSAMKSAGAALEKKDYITAEQYFGIAAREFKKMDKSPAATIKAASPKTPSLSAEELKAHMPTIKQFGDDIQKVYYLSKDEVTKEFLLVLVMVEDGAKLLVDHPNMLELTNQILKNDDMKNVTGGSDKFKKEQDAFLKGMYNTKFQDINKGY